MDNTLLLQKCKSGDPNAWNLFIKRMGPLVKKCIAYKLKTLGLSKRKDITEDICQEIFFALWEKSKLDGLRDARALEGWLAIVSMNMASNWCRKNIFKDATRCVSLDGPVSQKISAPLLGEFLTSHKLRTSKEIHRRELERIVKSEIQSLPARQKLAIKFNLYDGLKHREIAEIMNVPINTVSTLIKRAKDRICENLMELFRIPGEL